MNHSTYRLKGQES